MRVKGGWREGTWSARGERQRGGKREGREQERSEGGKKEGRGQEGGEGRGKGGDGSMQR